MDQNNIFQQSKRDREKKNETTFKSFYCYWRCWYFYCFVFIQKHITNRLLHTFQQDNIHTDCKHSINKSMTRTVIRLCVGSLFFYLNTTKKKVLHFGGMARYQQSKHLLKLNRRIEKKGLEFAFDCKRLRCIQEVFCHDDTKKNPFICWCHF